MHQSRAPRLVLRLAFRAACCKIAIMGLHGNASVAGAAPAAASLAARIAAIATDRHFESALALYAARLTALYREHPAAIGLFGNLGRFAIVATFAAGPASIRQVAGTLLGPGLASRHRVAAHVAALRRSGAIGAVGRGAGARWQLAPWVPPLLHRWLDAVASPALA